MTEEKHVNVESEASEEKANPLKNDELEQASGGIWLGFNHTDECPRCKTNEYVVKKNKGWYHYYCNNCGKKF